MFCSGHTYFTQRMPFKLGLDPYVVHATFQFSGTPGKRWRLREALLWNVRRFPAEPFLYFQATTSPAPVEDAPCHMCLVITCIRWQCRSLAFLLLYEPLCCTLHCQLC